MRFQNSVLTVTRICPVGSRPMCVIDESILSVVRSERGLDILRPNASPQSCRRAALPHCWQNAEGVAVNVAGLGSRSAKSFLSVHMKSGANSSFWYVCAGSSNVSLSILEFQSTSRLTFFSLVRPCRKFSFGRTSKVSYLTRPVTLKPTSEIPWKYSVLACISAEENRYLFSSPEAVINPSIKMPLCIWCKMPSASLTTVNERCFWPQ